MRFNVAVPSPAKTALKIVAVLLLMYILNRGFDLLNAPSDFAVIAGVGIILAVAVVGTLWFGAGVRRAVTNLWARYGKPLALVAAVGASTSGCFTVVEPGHAGIKVNMQGGERGVSEYTVTTGRVFYNPITTRVFQYPTFVQTAVWTKDPIAGDVTNEEISFNSSEGITFTADISLSYQIDAARVPEFYVKFRNDDIDQFTHGFLRNIARDGFTELAPEYTTEAIYSVSMSELVLRVRDRVNLLLSPYGVTLEQFGFIGAPRPPVAIATAISAKTAAIQNADAALNRVAQIEAEAQQAIALATGEAESNRILTASLSTNLLEWRRLGIQEQATAKWNGALPQFTSGGGSIPLIQFPTNP